MTLQQIALNFLIYEENITFFFISVPAKYFFEVLLHLCRLSDVCFLGSSNP
jgi:hypothetical protein